MFKIFARGTKAFKLTKSQIWMQQARALCTDVRRIHSGIGDIYNTLLEQSTADFPIPCNFVSQVVDSWAMQPNKLAIHCVDQDIGENLDITYAEVVKRSHQIAHFFTKQGFKKGDAVALMLGQRPAWWYSLAGLMRAGIPVVPFSRLLTPKDLLYRIKDLGIRGIITSPELQERIDLIRDQCSSLKTTVTVGTAVKGWESLIDIFNGDTVLVKEHTTVEDACLYLYTSGTTGQPKAVQHNHDYPFFHWPTGKRWLRATPEDLVYNASDTGWGFTVWITAAVWAMGSKLLITPTNKKYDPQKMLVTLRDKSVTIFCAAPTVLRLLVSQPNFDSYNFPTLKRIATVGEALDETVIEKFASRGIEVAVGFGQAETPLLMGRVDDQSHVPGTMGQPINPYRVVVLDDNLCPLPPGNVGQIALDLVEGKAAGLMRGYANALKKTQDAFSPDGRYYLTGDWAEYRKDGLFAYQGRRDDLIKSRGYRIGPDEVEKAGMSHSAVSKIAVVGVRTQLDSPAITVKAFILLKPNYIGSPDLIQEIQEHIKKETAPNKYPRLIEFLNLQEWEQYETMSGKIRRVALREREEKKLAATEGDTLRSSPSSGRHLK